MDNVYSTEIKILSQFHFEVPIETHPLELSTNVRSLMMCGAFCDRLVFVVRQITVQHENYLVYLKPLSQRELISMI